MQPMISVADSARGDLYAHVFENIALGIPRNLFWSFTLPCNSILWNGEEWPCSISCEWLQWALREWADLDGETLRSTVDQSAVECSIYFAGHHEVSLEDISVSRVAGTNSFKVTVGGSFDLDGFGGLDEQDLPIRVTGIVDFSGIVVVPENLAHKPTNAKLARETIAALVSVANLEDPIFHQFRYLFPPKEVPPERQ